MLRLHGAASTSTHYLLERESLLITLECKYLSGRETEGFIFIMLECLLGGKSLILSGEGYTISIF